MIKHKNKIIAAVIILAALSGAWLWGGNYNKRDSPSSPVPSSMEQIAENPPSTSGNTVTASEIAGKTETPGTVITPSEEPSAPLITASPQKSQAVSADAADYSDAAGDPVQQEDITALAEPEPPDAAAKAETPAPQQPPSPVPEIEPNADTGLDMYQTSQVPDGRPAPVEPQNMIAGDGSFTVTLTVRCDMILENMNLLNKEKHELVPEDGVIFATTTVIAYEGESVFNVLQREMRRAGIHMTFRNTPIYNSAYIEAINNLYEFDVGELSGWMYKVNGWFPNYGCSRYLLQPGDVIELHYTCDLGRDLGEYWLGAGWGQVDE